MSELTRLERAAIGLNVAFSVAWIATLFMGLGVLLGVTYGVDAFYNLVYAWGFVTALAIGVLLATASAVRCYHLVVPAGGRPTSYQPLPAFD